MPDLRWALTVPFSGIPLADHGELYRRIEAAGYDDVWTSETAGYDGFTPLALAAVQASRLRLAPRGGKPLTRGAPLLAPHCAAPAHPPGGGLALGPRAAPPCSRGPGGRSPTPGAGASCSASARRRT